MKLNLGRTLMLLLGLSAAIFGSSAQAQVDPNSYFYLAHAASGRQYDGGNPVFPLDISLNGVCISKGQSFGEIRGPFSAPAASFTFVFSAANSLDPCSNPALYSFTRSTSAGTTYVAALTLNGSNALTSLVSTANLSTVGAKKSRLVVVNATQNSLTATLKGSTTQTAPIAASSFSTFLPPAGMYAASISSGATTETGPVNVNLLQNNVYIFVVAGSTSNSSIQLFGPKPIWDAF